MKYNNDEIIRFFEDEYNNVEIIGDRLIFTTGDNVYNFSVEEAINFMKVKKKELAEKLTSKTL